MPDSTISVLDIVFAFCGQNFDDARRVSTLSCLNEIYCLDGMLRIWASWPNHPGCTKFRVGVYSTDHVFRGANDYDIMDPGWCDKLLEIASRLFEPPSMYADIFRWD